MNNEQHEQLSTGVGAATGGDGAKTVRINPIPEGERTSGQSGEETVWPEETLREAVESGALDGATIVKGEGGRNPHFPMDEQVPPENILGRVDSWEYEDGVGPVGEAQLADEDIANRVELGLLDVSPDMFRELGEFDEQLQAKPAESIIEMPRITVLETGAARNATIEPARAEALAIDPDSVEQNATTGAESPAETDNSNMGDNDELREQLSSAQSRVSELEDTKEQLAEEKETLETEKSELEEQLSEKEDKVDNLESEVEQLSPLKNVLAEAVAGDSKLSAEQLGDRFTTSELIESLEDEESDKSAVETVQEQLAAGAEPRGEGSGEEAPEDNDPSEEAEQLAKSVMNVTDLRNADKEGLSNTEYLAREYDVDATEYGDVDTLRAAKAGDN